MNIKNMRKWSKVLKKGALFVTLELTLVMNSSLMFSQNWKEMRCDILPDLLPSIDLGTHQKFLQWIKIDDFINDMGILRV